MCQVRGEEETGEVGWTWKCLSVCGCCCWSHGKLRRACLLPRHQHGPRVSLRVSCHIHFEAVLEEGQEQAQGERQGIGKGREEAVEIKKGREKEQEEGGKERWGNFVEQVATSSSFPLSFPAATPPHARNIHFVVRLPPLSKSLARPPHPQRPLRETLTSRQTMGVNMQRVGLSKALAVHSCVRQFDLVVYIVYFYIRFGLEQWTWSVLIITFNNI